MTAVAPAAGRKPGTFLGEPIGLAYLAFTEAWERFSYYGMTSLLTLYMTQQLFLPGHVENVVGFGGFRAAIESVFGPLTPLALASQVYGLYTGFVYFTPIFGGLIADRWLGRRNAVVLGAIMMGAGHIFMAFDQSFLLALLLLVLGCGLLKGNISTQVGELYGREDDAGRTRGFAIFSTGINVGAVAGPLTCGLLAQLYGWHVGFGLAGLLMMFGLATYLVGYRHLPGGKAGVAAADRSQPEALPPADSRRIVIALCIIIAIAVFHTIAYYQITNLGLVWIDAAVNLDLFGFQIPASWFNSIDSLVSILAVAPLLVLWRAHAGRGKAPSEMSKIAQGAAIACLADLVLMLGAMQGTGVHVLFPLTAFTLHGVAFIYVWPTVLGLVAGKAPPRLKATMMGVAFLNLFAGNLTIGWIGGFYEKLGPVAFWALHAGIAATGAALTFAFGAALMRATETRAAGQA